MLVSAVVVYSGMPVAFATLLWRHRNKIRADQGLRARGIGNSSTFAQRERGDSHWQSCRFRFAWVYLHLRC